jgi:hypothetical protein
MKEENKFIKNTFSENDNSAKEYKEGLNIFLKEILDNHPSDWSAMLDYTLYLQGAEQMLKEIINLTQ